MPEMNTKLGNLYRQGFLGFRRVIHLPRAGRPPTKEGEIGLRLRPEASVIQPSESP